MGRNKAMIESNFRITYRVQFLAILFLFFLRTSAQKIQYIYCDSIIYKDLVLTYDWTNLPANYKFISFDTIIGANKFRNNTRLESNGRVVAYGSLDKKGRPTSWWGIKSNITNPSPNEDFCCGGFMKRGKKKNRWWAMEGFYIVYSKNKKTRIGHNQFTSR